VPPFGAAPLPLAQGISGVRERRFWAVKTTVADPDRHEVPAMAQATGNGGLVNHDSVQQRLRGVGIWPGEQEPAVMAKQPGVWPPGRCTTWPALSKTSGPWVAWFALPGAQADFRAAGIARRPEGLNAG